MYNTGQLPSRSEVQALLATLRGYSIVAEEQQEEEHQNSPPIGERYFILSSFPLLSPSLMEALETVEPLDRD